ncbi:hypothetical protein [Rhizorhapis sp.]|uniref:hypothetical protein n=1 Tax=Rhizorhapis sp. TaxID=1968842 RepID=UPI002B4A44A9|nr:hypothetical protein [Rhizorhapis sp.]HKR16587.1 hypothetical protein [Rhizorhapis sp.]HKX36742.1 hypothetical protein [Rhizorhapis sp.]
MVLHKIATAVLANHVKSETGKAGALGMLAGLAATTLLRRSVPGAVVIGGVVVARQLIKMKRSADARRAAEAEGEAAEKVAREQDSV